MGERQMKIVEDIELDDSELHRRTEEHIKEINEKNRRAIQEIYDEVMEYRRNRKTNEIRLEGDFIRDLKKVEKNFHDLIRGIYKERDIPFDLPEITEELLAHEDVIDLPGTFGGYFYFLAIEDEKPVLYVNAFSRMDLDLDRMCIIGEDSCQWIEDGNYAQKRIEHHVEIKR